MIPCVWPCKDLSKHGFIDDKLIYEKHLVLLQVIIMRVRFELTISLLFGLSILTQRFAVCHRLLQFEKNVLGTIFSLKRFSTVGTDWWWAFIWLRETPPIAFCTDVVQDELDFKWLRFQEANYKREQNKNSTCRVRWPGRYFYKSHSGYATMTTFTITWNCFHKMYPFLRLFCFFRTFGNVAS